MSHFDIEDLSITHLMILFTRQINLYGVAKCITFCNLMKLKAAYLTVTMIKYQIRKRMTRISYPTVLSESSNGVESDNDNESSLDSWSNEDVYSDDEISDNGSVHDEGLGMHLRDPPI